MTDRISWVHPLPRPVADVIALAQVRLRLPQALPRRAVRPAVARAHAPEEGRAVPARAELHLRAPGRGDKNVDVRRGLWLAGPSNSIP